QRRCERPRQSIRNCSLGGAMRLCRVARVVLDAFNYPSTYTFDAVIRSLQDFQSVLIDLQTDPTVRDVFERLGNQSVDGLRSVAWKVPAQRSIYLAQIGRAIDHQCAVVLRVYIRAAQGVLIAELADDFFKNVFQRDDPQ